MSDTPRTDAMVLELYADAARRKRTPSIAAQDPFDRALNLCIALETELTAALQREKDWIAKLEQAAAMLFQQTVAITQLQTQLSHYREAEKGKGKGKGKG